jgi:hypothetical protein
MATGRLLWLVLMGLLLTASLVALAAAPPTDQSAADGKEADNPHLHGPQPKQIAPPAPQEIRSAIQRGVDFLLKRQNPNGSWGSPYTLRPVEVFAPVPGAHHAFRAGTTGLCVAALVEAGSGRADVASALDRAEAWMLRELPNLRRATPEAIYNNWGHAYSIQAAVRLLSRPGLDEARKEKLRQLVRQQIEMLQRYEFLDGGWAYYDFAAHTQKPSGSTISFVTATVLVALHEAKQAGFDIPEPIVQRGTASILRQRKPDFSYLYGEYLKYAPMHPVNRPAGSLGRSQVCNLAMRLWGDSEVTDEVVRLWLDRLFARNLWLDMGRKRPIPHESHFAIAGYFFYYGHYYAARCIELLPPDQRTAYQSHLAHVLLRLQEKDGSWWDFPLYDYHQQYGTAFALMSLVRCRSAAGAAEKP